MIVTRKRYLLININNGNLSDENLKTLMSGYQDYFDTYGKDMTALALRDFRRGILSTISNSRKNQVGKGSAWLTADNRLLYEWQGCI